VTDPLNVYRGMAQVIAELDYIPKGRSAGVSYEFRGIDAVMNHLHGPLARAGLFLAPRVLDDWQLNMIPGTNNRQQGQALFRVEVEVFASDGSSVTLGPGLAQSHDYGDKAAYQAQQNAIKYLLLEAFCIPTSEQDMDGRESDAVPSVDLAPLEALIVTAEDVGLSKDWAKAREFAARSPAHLQKTLDKLRADIKGSPVVAEGDGKPPAPATGGTTGGQP
jgi:hypothetical protein